ncbi:unnamed protein product, partial [Rotaria sordida]
SSLAPSHPHQYNESNYPSSVSSHPSSQEQRLLDCGGPAYNDSGTCYHS